MRATRASLEPLWFLYDGAGKKVDVGRAAPDLEFKDSAGLQQRLWVVGDERWIYEVRQMGAASAVLIADGHHRYETTLAYSEEIDGAADAASRFTLALLTDLDDPGLVVLPTHRVMKAGVAVTGGEPAGSLAEVLAAIDGKVAAGVYREGRFQVLPLEGEVAVVELHRQGIDNIFRTRKPEGLLLFTPGAQQAVRGGDSGGRVCAFFLGA